MICGFCRVVIETDITALLPAANQRSLQSNAATVAKSKLAIAYFNDHKQVALLFTFSFDVWESEHGYEAGFDSSAAWVYAH